MLDVLQRPGDARRFHRERPADGRRQHLSCSEGGGTQDRVPKKVATLVVDHGTLQTGAPRSWWRDCMAQGARGRTRESGSPCPGHGDPRDQLPLVQRLALIENTAVRPGAMK
jgi:hypothetical protein